MDYCAMPAFPRLIAGPVFVPVLGLEWYRHDLRVMGSVKKPVYREEHTVLVSDAAE